MEPTREEILIKSSDLLLSENDDLISERDEIRDWLIELGNMLGVVAKNEGATVRENWALFRKDIIEIINLKYKSQDSRKNA